MLPLEGIFVVALEQAVAAPTCTVRLADAGARVIKVEREQGETARHYDKAVKGTSAYFAWLNRGKESVVLDIKDEGDKALLQAMIAKADIFIQNFAPGAMDRIGLDHATLRARHSRLICVNIAGYAQVGEVVGKRAYDLLIQADSGVCSVTGTPETPVRVGVSIADVMTGMNAHAAVLEALAEREQTGEGKALEISLFSSMADLMSVPLLHHEYANQDTPRTGLSHAAIHPYSSVKCIDGEIVVVVQNPAEWVRFCDGALEQPQLANDPRFLDNPLRVKHREELSAIMNAVFGELTTEQAIERLEAHQLAWSKVSSVEDLSRHVALERMACEVPGGTFEAVRSPIRDNVKSGIVPELGADTDAVRAEFSETPK